MSLTVLPTRTDGSLGETKEDPGLAVASKYQLKLTEWNLAADLIVDLVSRMGLDGDAMSLRYIAERLGYGSPRYYRHTEHFLVNGTGVPDAQVWTNGGVGLWGLSGVLGGACVAPLDDIAGGFFSDWNWQFKASHLPRLAFRVTMGSIHADAGVPVLGMVDAAGNDGWYITYDSAVSAKWQVVTLVGGVHTATAVGPDVAAGTALDVDVQIVYDASGPSYDAQVNIGGGSTYVVAGLTDGIAWGRTFAVGVGGVGAAGKVITLSRLVTEADFGA